MPAAGAACPPWVHAGNLDNTELVAGTTLFIPVHVRGALFEVGDGHAAQGDGEVDQTGIETSLEGELQLIVRKDMSLEWPLGETPRRDASARRRPTSSRWALTRITEATRIAVDQTVSFIAERTGLTRGEAYRLTSLVVDLRITQLVDRMVGVHAMIPKSVLGL